MSEAITWEDNLWVRVATGDVKEDDGQFYECAIYAHRSGGGHCLFFGEEEYEGMGSNQSCGMYSFEGGVLKDADGDLIPIRNIVRDRDGESSSEYDNNQQSGEESEEEEYIPAVCQRRRRRGRQQRCRFRSGQWERNDGMGRILRHLCYL